MLQKKKIQVFLAGDSTVANYPDHQAPMAGWGQLIGTYFSNDVSVCNEARCGKSSKSFVEEGRLQKILDGIQSGDYLLVQFGHNDNKPRGTLPFTTFQQYLTQYIDGAREKGALPVLVTPVQRRRFDDNGLLVPTHGEYPEAIFQLARQKEVPVIDLLERTEKLYLSLGIEGSKRLFVWFQPNEHPNYPEGVLDNTHFHEFGADLVAQLVIDEIRKLQLPLAKHIAVEDVS